MALTEVKQNLCRATVRVLMSVSDTGRFINLQYTNIYTLHAQFSKHPGSDVNLPPEPDSLTCKYHVRNPPASEGLWLGSKSFSEPWKQAEGDAAEVWSKINMNSVLLYFDGRHL